MRLSFALFFTACLVSGHPQTSHDHQQYHRKRQDDEDQRQAAWLTVATGDPPLPGVPPPEHYSKYESVDEITDVPSSLTDGGLLPEWVVFDLDYTLWPFFFNKDWEVTDDKDQNGCFFDTGGAEPWVKYRNEHNWGLFPGTPKAILAFAAAGFKIAIASSNTETAKVENVLKWVRIWHPSRVWHMTEAGKQLWPTTPEVYGDGLVSIWDLAHGPQGGVQVFQPTKEPDPSLPVENIPKMPKSKQAHMAQLAVNLKIDPKTVLFFDDFHRNKRDLQAMGVFTQLVPMTDGLTVDIIDEAIAGWRLFKKNPDFEKKLE